MNESDLIGRKLLLKKGTSQILDCNKEMLKRTDMIHISEEHGVRIAQGEDPVAVLGPVYKTMISDDPEYDIQPEIFGQPEAGEMSLDAMDKNQLLAFAKQADYQVDGRLGEAKLREEIQAMVGAAANVTDVEQAPVAADPGVEAMAAKTAEASDNLGGGPEESK